MIKRYFITGLVLLLPVVMTVAIVAFIVNLLTRPFQQAVEAILSQFGLLNRPLWFLTEEQFLYLISKILIIITLFVIMVAAGLLAQIVVARYLIRVGDYIIHRIPVVNKVYKAAQDVANTLFRGEKTAFSQVVLVPFPHKNSYSIGFVTSDSHAKGSACHGQEMISVFLPATPNPTVGFMLLFKKTQLILLDMKVEDALKAIISCGVMLQHLSKQHVSGDEKH